MEYNPAAALLSQVFVPVFESHVVFRETAVFVVKLHAVHSQQFRKQLSVYLLLGAIESIAINKIALFLWMRVQVYVEAEPVLHFVIFPKFP